MKTFFFKALLAEAINTEEKMLKFILLFHQDLWQIDLFTSPILLFHLLHVTLLKSQVYIIV